jgi:hypothetical protein
MEAKDKSSGAARALELTDRSGNGGSSTDELPGWLSRPEFLSKIPNAYMCVNPRPGISRGTQ